MRIRRRVVLVMTVLSFSFSLAHANTHTVPEKPLASVTAHNLQLHGFIMARQYYQPRKKPRRRHAYETRNDLRLELSKVFAQEIKFVCSMNAAYDEVKKKGGGFENEDHRIELWDGYVDVPKGPFNFRLGKQAIRWGKSDEVNPTDNFTPEIWNEFLNFDRADRKLPVPMAKIDYFFKEFYGLEFIWLPYYVPSRIAIADSDWEPYTLRYYHALGVPVNEKRPAENLTHPVAALRLKRNGINWDWTVSYAYHYDELPAAYLTPVGVDLKTNREHTVGSSFATNVGKVGVRGEGAYIIHDTFATYAPTDSDLVVRKDNLQIVLGADYTFKNDIYANVQYLLTWIPHHTPDMYMSQWDNSVIYTASRKFYHDLLKLGISGRIYFTAYDLYIKSYGEYDVSDAVKVTLAWERFYGRLINNFGQYRDNEQISLKVKYSF